MPCRNKEFHGPMMKWTMEVRTWVICQYGFQHSCSQVNYGRDPRSLMLGVPKEHKEKERGKKNPHPTESQNNFVCIYLH